MKILNNQRIDNLRPEIQLALRVAENVWFTYGAELEITWTTGGKHGEHSLHPKRRAFDCLPTIQSRKQTVDDLKRILGPDYDVVDEGDHIHVEWDPK